MRPPRRLRAFAAVGVLGFIAQIAALDALVRHAALPYPVAVALAVEGAILHNFLWHEGWTWRDRRAGGLRGRLTRLARFNAGTAATSIAGNVIVTVALVEGLAMPVVAAGIAAVILVSALNFVLADRLVFRAAGLALVLLAAAAALEAAELSPATAAAYDEYVRRTEERLSREAADDARFLWIDFQSAEQAAAMRGRLVRGAIVALAAETRGAADAGVDVPGGLIHHWRGYVFIPGVAVDDLIAALRDPDVHRQEEVLEARVSDVRPGRHVLFLKLRRTGIVSAAYNTEHVITYARGEDGRATSRSVSRRIAEIERLGDGREHERPVGRDRGFLWRMNSYWRYEAVPGGVIVELESITLSRDLPWGLGAVARPIIGRVARESVVRTLAALRDRFEGSPPTGHRSGAGTTSSTHDQAASRRSLPTRHPFLRPTAADSAKAPSPSSACVAKAAVRKATYSHPPPWAVKDQPFGQCTRKAPAMTGINAADARRVNSPATRSAPPASSVAKTG